MFIKYVVTDISKIHKYNDPNKNTQVYHAFYSNMGRTKINT